MIEPGTLIDDRYEVLERVGSGGMADVYLASDRLLGRRVAVKVLHHRFAEDEEFVERFKREASSAAGLSHPNVVSIFDRGAWDGTFYIAMEYLPGRTLKELLREGGPLQPASAIDVVLQVLRAARFAHRRGVIHRDLKPHNVILDEEGRAKVTDFGIARAGASDMTLTGSIMGTAQYLSPEQAQGHSVTEASDMYAIGVMLYELLVGRVPFDGETAVTIALQHVSQDAPPPSGGNPTVPSELDAIVLKMMAKDPAQRYPSTSEAIAALEAVRASLPEPVGEHVLAAAPRRVRLGAAAAPAATGAGNGAGYGAAAAGALAAYAAERPTGAEPVLEDPASARARRRRQRAAMLVGALLLLVAIAAVLLALLLPASSSVVPNVQNKPVAEARAILKRDHFVASTKTASNASVPAGNVVTETPSAGSKLKRGSTVTLVVSSGRGTSTIPKVTGLSEHDAGEALHKAKLKYDVSRRASEAFAAGEAIGTEPKAAKRVPSGKEVTLIVSSGPQKVRVPRLRGDARSTAEAALEEAGLAVGKITYKPQAGAKPETVVAQTPGADSLRLPGTEVALVLAKAPAKPSRVSVPSVLGQTREEAESRLAGEGLEVRIEHTAVSEPAEAKLVVSQEPRAGTTATKGSTVTIFLGRLSSSTSTTETTSQTTETTETTSTTDTTSSTPPPGG
ncbi:MAG: Stk1 family PASTA domain-containing Ser/Thr kinase [Solirubrobacteraceae bacterium]